MGVANDTVIPAHTSSTSVCVITKSSLYVGRACVRLSTLSTTICKPLCKSVALLSKHPHAISLISNSGVRHSLEVINPTVVTKLSELVPLRQFKLLLNVGRELEPTRAFVWHI